MRLRGLSHPGRLSLESQCTEERGLELGQMAMSLDPSEAGSDIEERECEPALPLGRSLRGGEFGATFLDQCVRRLDAVGGLERCAQHTVDAEAVERGGVVFSPGRTRARRMVAVREFPAQLHQWSLGLRVGRPVIGVLQSPPAHSCGTRSRTARGAAARRRPRPCRAAADSSAGGSPRVRFAPAAPGPRPNIACASASDARHCPSVAAFVCA